MISGKPTSSAFGTSLTSALSRQCPGSHVGTGHNGKGRNFSVELIERSPSFGIKGESDHCAIVLGPFTQSGPGPYRGLTRIFPDSGEPSKIVLHWLLLLEKLSRE